MRSVRLALVLALTIPVFAAQTITICKKATPAGSTGFPFVWTNGSSGPVTPFTLDDGQCRTFDITNIDHFNKFTENVPPGWSLANISCVFTTSAVTIVGANPSPGFEPGDNTVQIDLNEAAVTCTFWNRANEVPPMDVYAAKFLCGDFRPKVTNPPNGVEWPVKPGNYLTVINVHNPNRKGIAFRKKAVMLYRANDNKFLQHEIPLPPAKLYDAKLEPDWGMRIDCPDIRAKLFSNSTPAPTFIEGWIILEVTAGAGANPMPLDVTAVYTSHGWDLRGTVPVYAGFAQDVEAILPKRVQ